MIPDYLAGGSVRYRGKDCAFLFTRVRPGLLLTLIEGFDRGELGSAPLDEVVREHRRFRRPISWFLDATAAENAASPVFQEWVRWFAAHRDTVKSVSMLTGSEPMRLTAAMAQQMSGLGRNMSVFTDRASFDRSLAAEHPRLPSDWPRAEAAHYEVHRESSSTIIRSQNSNWTFTYASRHALLVRIEGDEDGTLRNLHLDEAEAMLSTRDSPRHWYIDMRDVRTLSPRLVDEWSGWIAARQSDLARVHAALPAGAAGLLVEISSARERLGSMLSVYTAPQEFDQAILLAAAAGR